MKASVETCFLEFCYYIKATSYELVKDVVGVVESALQGFVIDRQIPL